QGPNNEYDEDFVAPGNDGPKDELNYSFAGLSASSTILTILNQMDLNDDFKLSPEEVINGVRDVLNDADAITSNFGAAGQPTVSQVADAFAAMNNQPHLDASGF